MGSPPQQPEVSIREQAAIQITALRRSRSSTFRALTADCEGTLVVVARFLALLELYREGAVVFEQVAPLGELHIRWTGTDEGEIEVPDEFDVSPEPAVDRTGDEPAANGEPDDETIDLRENTDDQS
jgi:segregation and condensation protein A